MNKLMRKLWAKKESKKGFTLVELIVVLVILAILAAIMVPSLIGWIDKAREKETVLEARNAYLAAQTIVQEEYVKGTAAGSITISNDKIEKISNTGGVSSDIVVNADYVITGFKFTKEKGGKIITAIYSTTDGVGSWDISSGNKTP